MNNYRGSQKKEQGKPDFRLNPVAAACLVFVLGMSECAYAQQAETQAAPDTAVQAKKEDKKADAAITTVEVVGIRRGIESAISIKKNSSSIVEAISAEDIGKLPNDSVAESVSTLSGVSVQRDMKSGKSTSVSVRGLSPAFNGSLLNGRQQASTGLTRSPEFDLFPAELTASVLIYKTPDATLMDQGLASTIDLNTVRPLDFGKRNIVGSIKKERNGIGSGAPTGSGKRGTLSYIDQFADRTIGLSIGLTSYREDNGSQLIFDSWGDWVPTVPYNGANVAVPGGFNSDTMHRKDDRDSAALTLQFRPNRNFKSTFDVYYSAGSDSERHTMFQGAIPYGAGGYDPNGDLTNATIVDGVATSGTENNYKAVIQNNNFSSKDKLLSFGLNAELKIDDWRLEADLSHSHGRKDISRYETYAGQPGNVPAAGLGTISWTGFNGKNFTSVKYTTGLNYSDRAVAMLTDVNGWGGGPNSPQAGYLALPTINDSVNTIRLTGHRDLEWGPLVSAHVGVNVTKRDKSSSGMEGLLSIKGGDPYAAVTMPGSTISIAGPVGIPVASWDPTGSLGSIYQMAQVVTPDILTRFWGVHEKVNTLYAMGNLDGTLLGLPYTGNIGAQLVHTDQSSTGNQVDLASCTGNSVSSCPYKVNTDGTSYTNFLPSLNLSFDLGSDQHLRIGAGKQISRANLDDMKASLSFAVQSATALAPALTGFAGNPELKPYTARAFDISYEKYFAKHGYISVAAFYKKLDNYILNVPVEFDFKPYTSASTPLPTTGPYANSTVGFLTKPQNGEGGNMHGFEFALNVPFSMLTPVLDGFGTVVNYSYTASGISLPTAGFISAGGNAPAFNGSVTTLALPGLSKNVSSIRAYYEHNGFQIAWAAHKRSNFVGNILDARSQSQFTFIKGEIISDLQVSYEGQSGWFKNWTALAQVHNLTNTPFREFNRDPNVITHEVRYGKTVSFGLNYKY